MTWEQAWGDANAQRLQRFPSLLSLHRLLTTGTGRRDFNSNLHVGVISHQGASRWRPDLNEQDFSLSTRV
jgi:hypothetical protein